MRIAIEALGIGRPGGGRTATLNFLRPLLTLDQTNEYIIYLDRPEPELANLSTRARQRIIPIQNRFISRLCLQIIMPVELRQLKVDLIHFAKNQMILGCGVPTVVTVYDLTTLRHPEAFPVVDVWYWRHLLPEQYRHASRIVAISESTAQDLVAYYRLPRERIAVIYPGYAPGYRPLPVEHSQTVRHRYGLDEQRYFIHVGSFSLKKNLAMLIDAFLDFRQRTNFDGRLVLVGANYPKGRDQGLARRLARPEVGAAVVLTGPISNEDLAALYNGALALLFPSLHEGFGLVALEAMACGVPVVAHAAGAVREVVDDAGLIIESTTDLMQWSQALQTIAVDDSLRAQLSRAGLERSRAFAPEIIVHQTLSLYQDVLKQATTGRGV